jgi:peptidoglycan/xylan/chitin deacetylase (PgdA/CDA1 family)
MYHRVTTRIAGVSPPTWNVDPRQFRRQLEGLLARGYQAWPLRRVLTCRREDEPIPARVFVVTFDDGYDNIYLNAWPILKELSVPATVFLVTSYLDDDHPFTCDDWAAAGSKSVPAVSWQALSTAHCAEMIEHGLVEVGSHTHTHGFFPGRSEEFRSDLARSLDVLRDKLGVHQASFAFPFGCYDPDLVQAAHEANVLCALTAQPELVQPQTDPFSWGRFAVAESDTAATLALKLSGWYTKVWGVWRWLHRSREAGRAPLGQRDGRGQPAESRLSPPSKVVSP